MVEVASGKILFSYTATDSYNLVSDLSKDNKYLAAPKRAATNIDLRAIPSGKVMRTLKGLNALPALVKFTKDTSKLIGYSRKGKLMIWEVESGKVLFEKETSRPKNISFMDDGKFKLTYFDGKASSFKLAQN